MTFIEIKKHEPLGKHTFYGVGGPADEFWQVNSAENFGEIWAETIALKLPKMILGKGSNTVFSDVGFRGRVFQLNFDKVIVRNVTSKNSKQGVGNSASFWTVEVGKNWQSLVEETAQSGWEDLKDLSGIPGNFGGFVRGNAGAFGSETGDFVASVEYVDENGMRQTMQGSECEFAYRESIFKRKPDWCIIRATLKLEKSAENSEVTLQYVREKMKARWQKYPPGRSGGSFFKNPEGDFAGRLLESAGAKGDSIGGAEISEKHANFFLNKKKATQSDLLALARKWRDIVKEKFGVTLEPEIFLCDQYGQRVEL